MARYNFVSKASRREVTMTAAIKIISLWVKGAGIPLSVRIRLSGVRTLEGKTDFIFSMPLQTGSGAHTTSSTTEIGALSRG